MIFRVGVLAVPVVEPFADALGADRVHIAVVICPCAVVEEDRLHAGGLPDDHVRHGGRVGIRRFLCRTVGVFQHKVHVQQPLDRADLDPERLGIVVLQNRGVTGKRIGAEIHFSAVVEREPGLLVA